MESFASTARNVGQRLKQSREERNLTQAQIAEKLDMNVEIVQELETGKGSLPAPLWEWIAHKLDIDPQFLLYGEEPKAYSQPPTVKGAKNARTET